LSYTLAYGLEFSDWVRLKSQRIRDCLIEFYERNQAIDINYLITKVYFRRISPEPFSHWRAIDGHLLDFKPSPFIKSFVTYVLQELANQGYLKRRAFVEITESLKLSESFGSQNVPSNNSSSETLVRTKVFYYVKAIPPLEVLVNLNYKIDPIERAFYEELANEISKIKTVEQLEQFLYRKS